MTSRRFGLCSAMRQELASLLQEVETERIEHIAGREFHLGRLAGRDVVLVLCGIGKVAAATTATLLLDRFKADAVLLTGVAGGLADGVRVGDVIVADDLLQHDLDASPLFPRYEVPLTGRSRFACDASLREQLTISAERVLAMIHTPLAAFGIREPRLHRGLIASGDRFVSTAAESARLRQALPDALAVEMEGAAVAQVCAAFGRPFAVLRTVSDRADDSAPVDFGRFIDEVASVLTHRIVVDALPRL